MTESWYAAGLPPYSMMNLEPPIGSHSVKSKSLASSAPHQAAHEQWGQSRPGREVRGGRSLWVVTVDGLARRDDSRRDARALALKVLLHLHEPVLLVRLLVQPEASLLKVGAHAVQDGDVVHGTPVQHAPVHLRKLSRELREWLLLQPSPSTRVDDELLDADDNM